MPDFGQEPASPHCLVYSLVPHQVPLCRSNVIGGERRDCAIARYPSARLPRLGEIASSYLHTPIPREGTSLPETSKPRMRSHLRRNIIMCLHHLSCAIQPGRRLAAVPLNLLWWPTVGRCLIIDVNPKASRRYGGSTNSAAVSLKIPTPSVVEFGNTPAGAKLSGAIEIRSGAVCKGVASYCLRCSNNAA